MLYYCYLLYSMDCQMKDEAAVAHLVARLLIIIIIIIIMMKHLYTSFSFASASCQSCKGTLKRIIVRNLCMHDFKEEEKKRTSIISVPLMFPRLHRINRSHHPEALLSLTEMISKAFSTNNTFHHLHLRVHKAGIEAKRFSSHRHGRFHTIISTLLRSG